MSALEDIHQLLTDVQDRPLSDSETSLALDRHREFSESAARLRIENELNSLSKSLASVTPIAGLNRKPGGRTEQVDTVIQSALSISDRIGEGVGGIDILQGRLDTGCTGLLVPRPTMGFSSGANFGATGQLRQFSQADAERSTFEAVAAIGSIGGMRWDHSEVFIFPLNRANAFIAGNLRLPVLQDSHELTFTVSLQIENVYPWVTVPGEAALLASTVSPLITELPFGGVAAASCGARLTLHGGSGSHTEYRKIVSRLSAHGNSTLVDRTVNGRLSIPARVLVDSTTSGILYVIEVECEAVAEGADSPGGDQVVFAQFECRHKDPEEILGIYSPPSHIQIDSISARLCKVPNL